MGSASAAKNARQALRQELAVDAREFWHGGAHGLSAGTLLVPGKQVPGYSDLFAEIPQEELKVLAQGWVYVTTDRDLAADFAALTGSQFGAGALYSVQPLDSLAPDPDYAHFAGVSYRVRRARVIALEEEFDGTAGYSPTGAALRYVTWDDGTPMYDENGMPLPNATQSELGVKASDLVELGRGASFDVINAATSRIVQQLHPDMTQARIDVLRAKHLNGGRPR